MNSKKHLDYEDLLNLYKYISLGYSLEQVANLTGKSRTTIYRAIVQNSNFVTDLRSGFRFNKFANCSNILECKSKGIKQCDLSCSKYKKWICPNLKNFPYICNFCESKPICRKAKRIFNPEEAYMIRKDRNVESKSVPNIKKNRIEEFDRFITPLIKQGLSIECIYACLKDNFPVTSRTVRNWINKKYLSVNRLDLINAVKREYNPDYLFKRKVGNDPLRKVGRTMNSYIDFMKTHDGRNVLQFDTVHGKRTDKKCILTIHHPISKFQIGILLDSCTALEVKKAIIRLREQIGDANYFKLFRIMLCDNGLEFDLMPDLETDNETGEKYANVFYTRPYCSGDKGSCERNHELFRYVIAKGKSLDQLTQEDVTSIFNNINSYPRKSLGYKTPYDAFVSIFGVKLVTKLGFYKVPFKQLTFKKKLK